MRFLNTSVGEMVVITLTASVGILILKALVLGTPLKGIPGLGTAVGAI